MKNRLLAAVLILWLLPALACNLPSAPPPTATPPSAMPTVRTPTRSPTPTRLEDWGKSLPGQLAPTPEPPTQDAWDFPGLRRLTSFADDGTVGALEAIGADGTSLSYISQPGDTAAALARRFGVLPEAIHLPAGVSAQGYLPAASRIEITAAPAWVLPGAALLPDSEIVYGPSAANFSTADYVKDAGAYLNTYSEKVNNQTLSGAEIVQRVADEMGINPRILLAFLEYRSSWVLGWPKKTANPVYPIGFEAPEYQGLYKELVLVARQLTGGYYGWRSGTLGALEFPSGDPARLHPSINAGSAAVSLLLAKLYPRGDFGAALYGAKGFVAFYTWLFGDPWARAAAVEPQIPANFLQESPALELPFEPGVQWVFTGGPHAAWGVGSPAGALDFAPAGENHGCYISQRWVTAAAPGLVTVSQNGMLLLALDPSWNAARGWALFYLHLSDFERAPVGTRVNTGDRLGHASCQGGTATGTNLHITRRYNGEWLGIGDEAPFVLSGWRAEAGDNAYLGRLVRADGTIIESRSDGSGTAVITR